MKNLELAKKELPELSSPSNDTTEEINFFGEVPLTNDKTYAKYLIRNTNKSIKQISSEVGYNDSNYFSRVFKKNTGYSPSVYKKI